jgi:two-component system OmpR family response regulator
MSSPTAPSATTIVIAREDFSIPGGDEPDDAQAEPGARETRFFSLLRESKPDVVVLDLSRANGAGTGMILKIRRQSSVPILVVCDEGSRDIEDYRIAGAADCIPCPVDVIKLNRALQHIVRINGPANAGQPNRSRAAAPASLREADSVGFAGVSFRPHQNLVLGPGEARAHLTTAESRLLSHFLANPWEIQSRAALAEALYGKHRPATDRAIDVVVNRLRTKLRSVGDTTQHLIKTEFRRGYRFVTDPAVQS